MQERNNNSQPLGICSRLFNFFMDILMDRGLKRITLGKPGLAQDLPGQRGGKRVHEQTQVNVKDDPNADIQIQFKQSEGPIAGSDYQGQVPNSRTREVPHEMEILLVQGNAVEPNITSDARARGPKKSGSKRDAAANEDKSKKKGKGISITSENLSPEVESKDGAAGKNKASETLTTLVQPDDLKVKPPRRIKPLLDVATNINDKSDAFIRSRREKMSRNLSLEGKKS